MKNIASLWAGAAVAALAGAYTAACGSADHPASASDEQVGGSVSEPIVNGQPATAYPEAALVDGPGFYCSGSVVAPKVVLTAGHCVVGASAWTVRTPYAGNQSAHGSSSWTQYASTGETVNPNTVDVALIFLDTPITLTTYPSLASTEYPNGTKAINVGRIQNNNVSTTALFFGAAVSLSDASPQGFPYDYLSSDVIEAGDSGGPVYVGTGASRVIAAVNSGAGGGTQVLARTDTVYTTIQSQIAAHGGAGSSSSSSSGGASSSGGTSSGGSSSSSGAGSACTADDGAPTYDAAHPEAACDRGTLPANGQAWFTWSAASAGVKYAIQVTGGDVNVEMWKTTDGGASYGRVANTSPTSFANTSSSAGTYVLVVYSPSGVPATFTLTKS